MKEQEASAGRIDERALLGAMDGSLNYYFIEWPVSERYPSSLKVGGEPVVFAGDRVRTLRNNDMGTIVPAASETQGFQAVVFATQKEARMSGGGFCIHMKPLDSMARERIHRNVPSAPFRFS